MSGVIDEKKQAQHAEHIEDFDDPEKPQAPAARQDYSGAAEKTDPVEIALVRKLDRWIMVSPCIVVVSRLH